MKSDLCINNVRMQFSGVVALDDVSLTIKEGEILSEFNDEQEVKEKIEKINKKAINVLVKYLFIIAITNLTNLPNL